MYSIKLPLLLSAITLLLTLLLSCSKDRPSEPAAELAGVWQWVRSDGGLGNTTHETPASTGKSITLKLTADRQYFYYTNGNLTAQGTYTLDKGTCIHDHQQKSVIDFSACPDFTIHALDATSLRLSDEQHDGLESLYRRAEVSIY